MEKLPNLCCRRKMEILLFSISWSSRIHIQSGGSFYLQKVWLYLEKYSYDLISWKFYNCVFNCTIFLYYWNHNSVFILSIFNREHFLEFMKFHLLVRILIVSRCYEAFNHLSWFIFLLFSYYTLRNHLVIWYQMLEVHSNFEYDETWHRFKFILWVTMMCSYII